MHFFHGCFHIVLFRVVYMLDFLYLTLQFSIHTADQEQSLFPLSSLSLCVTFERGMRFRARSLIRFPWLSLSGKRDCSQSIHKVSWCTFSRCLVWCSGVLGLPNFCFFTAFLCMLFLPYSCMSVYFEIFIEKIEDELFAEKIARWSFVYNFRGSSTHDERLQIMLYRSFIKV